MDKLVSELENLNVEQINISSALDKRIFTGQRLRGTLTKRFANMSSAKISTEEATDDTAESSTEDSLDSDSECSEADSGTESELLSNAEIKRLENQTTRGGINARILPQRSAKRDSLLTKNLKVSMKPQKITAKSTQKLSPAEVKKLYTKQKLTKFRPSNLETIFEEPQPAPTRTGGGGGEQFRLIGSKKLRRSLVVSNGFNINKALVNRRRAKMKKLRKSRCALKKIPLENFLSYMRENGLESDNEQQHSDDVAKLATKSDQPTPLKALNEIEDFEMELSPKCNN